LRVVWPFIQTLFGCCLPKQKRKFKLGLKRAIRNKLDIKVPKSDLLLEKDPYLLLGYGMNSYFEIMVELMIMCGLICLVTIPLMYVYSTGGQFEGLNAYTLGNLGGAEAVCGQVPFNVAGSKITLACQNTVQTSINTNALTQDDFPVMDIGLISGEAALTNQCSNAELNKNPADSCTQYLKMDLIKQAVIDQCQGKPGCTIGDLPSYVDTIRAPEQCQ